MADYSNAFPLSDRKRHVIQSHEGLSCLVTDGADLLGRIFPMPHFRRPALKLIPKRRSADLPQLILF
jgi:hypothetical protein